MVNATRPSGATICVLKTFPNAGDCTAQRFKMTVAGADVSAVPTIVDDRRFTLPLYAPRIRTVAFQDLLGVYQRLWARLAPPTPLQTTRAEYHNYVQDRLSRISIAERGEFDFMLDDVYALVADLPITQNAFVHGDAIISNAVSTPDGPRLIDFAPRAAPPEVEVDFSKLLFSALGFDLSPRRCKVLRHFLTLLEPQMDPVLVRYYLVTHLIRVFSREPPQTLARVNFFRKVLNHVRHP